MYFPLITCLYEYLLEAWGSKNTTFIKEEEGIREKRETEAA